MKRYEHRRLNKHGQCRRCGLTPARAPHGCPPGFWMTAAEVAEWDAVPRDGSQWAAYEALSARFRESTTSLSNSKERGNG